MAINVKKTLIGAGIVVLLYQAYKMATKPKSAEKKSSASGLKKLSAGSLKYDQNSGKVSKLVVDGFDSRWVLLNEANQPKPMSWYAYNGKWVWVKWNGKFA